MKYKLIAVDMDGTLLSSSNTISNNNKKALKCAVEQGIKVVISTGRIFTSARYYAKTLGIVTPIIACNGAYISEYHRDNVLFKNPMKKEDCKWLIKILNENRMYFHFYDNENFYSKQLDYGTLRYSKWNEKQKEEDKINIEVLKNPLEFIDRSEIDILKFVIMDDDKKKLTEMKKLLLQNSDIKVVSSLNLSFDIMNNGVSKGNALKQLCNIYKIKKEEVIAIGDNENDVSMLKFAGTSVAMKNGDITAKKTADIITDSNDNDGVCKVLKELIL